MRCAVLFVASLFAIHASLTQTSDAQGNLSPPSSANVQPTNTRAASTTKVPTAPATNSSVASPTVKPTATATATLTPTATPGVTTTTGPVEIQLTLTFWIVFVGSALATFVASVMADEQEQRLRNGTLGAVAGISVGALTALISGDRLLAVSGFCGSTVGALIGWLVSLALSFLAAKTVIGKTMLAYQIGGLKGVKALLDLEENEPLKKALEEWGRRFTRRVGCQRDDVAQLPKCQSTDEFITVLLRGWLYSTVDVLGLLFKIAKRPQYQNRITLIVFGVGDGGKPLGKHWISDSGVLEEHNPLQEFDDTSIGYKVVTQQARSPYFFTSGEATTVGSPGQNRGDTKYRPFWTFRINDSAVLAIDWPGDLGANDQFLVITRDLFQLDIGPKIEATLAHRSDPSKLYEVVGLKGPVPRVEASPTVKANGGGIGHAVRGTATIQGSQDSGPKDEKQSIDSKK